MFNLALIYHFGTSGFKVDMKEAIKLYAQAAKMGHTGAIQMLNKLSSNNSEIF